MDDSQPLLGAAEQTVRKRNISEKKKHWTENIPEYAKVYLARRKKPDPAYVKIIEALVVIGTILFAIYCYLYFENVHFHAINAYAHLGYSEAQHQVGQRYLHGIGVSAHPEKAMEWFKKASDQGHPHASFNLAVGHLKGIKTPLKAG